MPRFFCGNAGDTACICGDEATICGEDAAHITKALRMHQGDPLTLCDGRGIDYSCVILETGDIVRLRICKSEKNQTEPQTEITLYQCLPKGEKLEFILQKAVELGAVRVVPVLSRFCVVKHDAASFEKKRQRLQKIAWEAAKQSGRGRLPEVAPLCSFQAAIAAAAGETGLLFYEGGGESVHKLLEKAAPKISLLVGSEGGFAPEEVEEARLAGISVATLGKRILRCETAPIVGLTLVLSAMGEL